MNEKVEHVRRARQTRDHTCHWPGCTQQVKPAMWGCRAHWYKLPTFLRDLIWDTYEVGQEISMTPSSEYLEAAERVQNWIRAKYPDPSQSEDSNMMTDNELRLLDDMLLSVHYQLKDNPEQYDADMTAAFHSLCHKRENGDLASQPILGFEGKYRFLSNFYPSVFTLPVSVLGEIGDCDFQWNEQWYMFHKSEDIEYQRAIMKADGPGDIKRIGRACDLRDDWEQIKDWVMLTGLRAKFNQNEDLAKRLLATGKQYLEETNTWGDTYWGVCRGRGRNMLGILLMQVRAELVTQVADYNEVAAAAFFDAQDGCPND